MTKISIKNLSSFESKPLNRAQLKKVTGGFSSAAGGCANSQGGCDIGANCARPNGAADKCSTASGTCKCGS